jgi:putative ABC transport system ATP-binding protein
LICDEPTSALDHATGNMILKLMKDISREMETTFVIVTHDARIFEYADRIAHMDDGVVTHVE